MATAKKQETKKAAPKPDVIQVSFGATEKKLYSQIVKAAQKKSLSPNAFMRMIAAEYLNGDIITTGL